MARRDDDELPLRLHPLSNGEYAPLTPTPVVREALRRTMATADDHARRLGTSRRDFLRSAAGMATMLTALAACNSEQNNSSPTSTPRSTTSDAPVGTGGTFELPPESTIDTEVATTVLQPANPELIIDVQTHFLDLPDSTMSGFGSGFPQAACGDSISECFSSDTWIDLVLGASDTTLAVLSAIPVVANPDPLSTDVMQRAREQVEQLGCPDRVLIQGHATPNIGSLDDALDAMSATAAEFDLAAWKTYTHEGPPWRLDDAIGEAFIGRARELGQNVICVHKGLGPAAASPVDIGPAAAAHPDMAFCVYHSGFEARVTEGAYPGPVDGAAAGGVDRLIASVETAGLPAGSNVYAELGSTWWNLIQRPDEAAHVLGKLLVAFGPDNVLWGTDSIWYGSPQAQIEAFRAFSITSEFQDRFGYPELTGDVKAKILGLNAARLYDIDPAVVACAPSADERVGLRRELAERGVDRLHGPTTGAEATAVFRREHPWF